MPAGMRVVPLGGLGEVGMNCLALCDDGHAIVVDCGVLFDDRGLGVDVISPDLRALDDMVVDGLVLTHGHEDHLGAVPYFLQRFDVPVWGPRYTLGLLAARAEEHEILRHARLEEAVPRRRFRVGKFEVEPVRVTHSIVDATALAIDGPTGRAFHTGDFKIDESVAGDQAMDLARIAELGKEGVDLLLSDSTNAEIDGWSRSEAEVGPALEAIVRDAPGAVVVSLFSSNVQRLGVLGRIALATGRRLVLMGRSVRTHAEVARWQGHIPWPAELSWPSERVHELPRNKILGVATGSQGEPQAALAKLARGEHPDLDLGEGDTVILSSRVIPGREPVIYGVIGDLLRRGVTVRSALRDPSVHVSGHAARDEQRRMIELVGPRAFVPIHGARHQLDAHARIARECGVSEVTILEDGETAHLEDGRLVRGESVMVARVHRWNGRAVAEGVIGERKALAQDGIVFVRARRAASGLLDGAVTVHARGVIPNSMQDTLVRAISAEAGAALESLPPPAGTEEAREAIRGAARRAAGKLTGRRPLAVVELDDAKEVGS